MVENIENYLPPRHVQPLDADSLRDVFAQLLGEVSEVRLLAWTPARQTHLTEPLLLELSPDGLGQCLERRSRVGQCAPKVKFLKVVAGAFEVVAGRSGSHLGSMVSIVMPEHVERRPTASVVLDVLHELVAMARDDDLFASQAVM